MFRTIMILVSVLILFTACGGDSEKSTLLGSVQIDPSLSSFTGTTCTAPGHPAMIDGGETVYVTLGNGDELTTSLSNGRVSEEGWCYFDFVIDVPKSDMYAFTVNNVTELRRDQTIQKSIPGGLGHPKQDEGDWWVVLNLLD